MPDPNLGDSGKECFSQLLIQHQPQLRGLVRCMMFNSDEADDVLQQTNIVLLRKADSFELGTNFWAWACAVARYEILSHCCKKSKGKQIYDSRLMEELAGVSERYLASNDRRKEALTSCLESLPATSRRLIELRYMIGHSVTLVAEATARPYASVCQSLYRIRKSLLQCVESRMLDPACSENQE